MRLRRLIRQNLWLKAAALALAVALWLFVTLRSQTEVSFEVEPEIRDIPEGYCLVEKRPGTVTVVIRGNERFLARLKPSDVVVPVSVPRAGKARVSLSVSAGQVKLPPHTVLVSMKPSEIYILLEKRLSLKLPVKPRVQGRPAEGYEIDEIEVSPETVEVRCLKREFGGLKGLSTGPVDISGADSDVIEDAPVLLPDRTAVVDPGQVTVKIKIRKS